jgi:hypothetical protein
MIRKIIRFVLVIVFAMGLFNCAPVRPAYGPPPSPKKEVRHHKPGPNYIWISGHYEQRHGRWVWIGGHWAKKRHGMVWVEGHWVKRGKRWVWIKGHWKKR